MAEAGRRLSVLYVTDCFAPEDAFERCGSRRSELGQRSCLTSILPLGTVRRVRTVILLRHGKSSWSDPTLADLDRPLAPRGERASRRIAEYMRRKKIRPSLVLGSPSLRTRQTLEAIEPSLGKGSSVELEPDLYA